ncbi:hypothetical protein [Actinokineospora globicatena]|uniref:hypothetical protein n=1 Tax=Actinokineospora globicatena TaxID=103729 RepID=UPI0020A2A66E|nr:hypothetical protein [Actinokineospora globicatena]MCP2304628.1 hypothetical protein [Actinokineospora globicatena]GLW78000.1 hypothetical protein Aglo01_24820 [Actinokineospora globicatena]GLW85334.1 hypothetical protein Aglo02_29740 [Actinokineospora globicatena]
MSGALRYDVLYADEAIAECTADIGTKRSKKIDYGSQVQVLVEAKKVNDPLRLEHARLSKEAFDPDSVISAAGELKYIGQIKRALAAEFREPSEGWVRYFTTKVYEGSFTQKVREQFTTLVDKAGCCSTTTTRKPIARLWFNRSKRYLGVFDEHKVETRVLIDRVEDIYQYADALRATVARYTDSAVRLPQPAVPAEAVAVN